MSMKMSCQNVLLRIAFAAVFAFSAALAAMAADMIANTPYADELGGTSSGVYRIPAMAKSTNGVVVAVYDCRYSSSGDLPNAIDIAENWSGDNGATWSKPRVAVDVPNTNNYQKVCNIGDPCIVYDPDGDKFWLMGITGGGLASSHDGSGNSIADVVLYTRGTGENDTWQEWTGGPEGNRRSVKQMILDSLAAIDPENAQSDENQLRGILQGPGHGFVQRRTVYVADGETILMPAGALVFPMQYFIDDNFSNTRTFAVYSIDGGATWRSTKLTPAGCNAQENCIMELDDGSWYMIAKGKTQSDKRRQLFRSTDYENWTYCGSITPSEWVQGSCLRLGEGFDGKGRYAACFSPASRENITLHFGIDTTAADPSGNGIAWSLGKRIVYPGSTGGMGYNSLVMLDDLTIGIILESSGQIYFIIEDISDILEIDELPETDEDNLVVEFNESTVRISNTNATPDVANWTVSGTPTLEIPANLREKLPEGTRIRLSSLDFGYVTDNNVYTHAKKIALSLGGDTWTSSFVVTNETERFPAKNSATRARLAYSFEDADCVLTVGESYTLSLLDASGNPLGNIRYALAQEADTILGGMDYNASYTAMFQLTGEILEEKFAARTFDWTPGGELKGSWFTSWTGEAGGSPVTMAGPDGTEAQIYVTRDDGQVWIPYCGDAATPLDDFTFVTYGNADNVTASAGKLAVLWCMGRRYNEKIALVKDESGNIRLVQITGENTALNKDIVAPPVSGWHLFTVRFSSSSGASLQIDDGRVYADSTFTTKANVAGFQVGSVRSGCTNPLVRGMGFAVLKMLAFDTCDMPEAQYAALCTEYPGVTLQPLFAAESISIDFEHGDGGLDTSLVTKIGLDGYKVPVNCWNTLLATNNASLTQLAALQTNGVTVSRSGMSVTVSGIRGYYKCEKLDASVNPLYGYIDDDDSHMTPSVTVTGIPYDKYRVIVYHSTDQANKPFGYDLVNGIPFTGRSGRTTVGTMNWGDSGPYYSAKVLEEGVNALVTPILHNNAEATLTVTGHRVSGVTRGCIAAIQIFDATDETDDFSNTTNRVSSTYASGVWSFPDDITAADPVKFGGMIIGTNAVSQSLGSSSASTISATVLAEIPETAAGTLISLGVQDGHSVHARYNGNGTFGLSYDTAGAVVTTAPIDVAGIHIWTLAFDTSNGAAFYKDGVKVVETSRIKWTYPSVKKIAGSVEFGAKHDQSDPLTGTIIYAARTDFLNAQASNAGDVVSSGYAEQEIPGVSGLATLAEKAELFTHLAAYGDTEGLLALMPHRTSTYGHDAWHSPLDAELADGDYVDGLKTVFNPVVQKLPGVSTNAAAASVLAQIPQTASGVIANITVVNGSSTHCVFARANGDGTVSLGWEDGTKRTTSGFLDGWDSIHVWTLVSHDSQGCKLYRDGELVLEDSGLRFNGYKAGASIMFGNATNSKHPLAGMNVYAVHTDFGSSSEIFDTAAESAASVFDSFDFMEELAGRPIDEKLAAFEYYAETGVAYEPPPVFEPENDEVAETCVLRISEIMPKPTDALNRGKLEGMDVNGLESGWVEVENTSPDKWADLGDYKFIRSNRGKKTGQADYGNFPSVMIAPGARYVFYTSERYSNSADMTVSAWAEADEDGVKPKLYGADLKDILVWPDKVNPKKSPFVRLIYTPTDAIVDTVVVPSDVPEGCSIIVGETREGEATARWLCPTPTRGTSNTATAGLVRIGPNAGPLYEISSQKKHDSASEFARPVPPAVPGEDYKIVFSFNPVMHPAKVASFRDEDRLTAIRLVCRADLDDATLKTNAVDFATKTTDAKDWGDTFVATIAAGDLPAAGRLVQWKFIATDASGNEWTSPSFNNPDDGYEWYGTIVAAPELESATLPTWHMFATPGSIAQMDVDAADQTLPDNARVAIYDSSTSNYYDYVRIDLRGNTSRNFTKKSHGLRFAKAHPLTMKDIVSGGTIKEIRKTSLVSEFADPSYMRQMIAFWLWRRMGNLVPFDFPVRCNLNGEFYQLAFNSERFTDELIEDVYGLDKFGYGYKNVGTMKSGSATTAGSIEKKTPDDEDESNITVLQSELRKPLYDYGAQNGREDNAALTRFVVEKFDLPAWLNYLASARITQEMDDVWANVCAYYDNAEMKSGVRGTDTWMPLGYDFNLSFGQHYLDGGMRPDGLMSTNDWFKSHPFYGGNCVRCYTSSAMTSTINNGNDGFEAVWQSAKFRRLYLRRLRTLMDAELKEPGTDESGTPFMAKMREMAELMRTDAALDRAKWPNDATDDAIDVWGAARPGDIDAGIDDIWNNYVVPRRNHLYVSHSATNTAKAVGYGSNLNAGIPEAQSPIAALAPNITLDFSRHAEGVVVVSNANDEVVDMSGWTLRFGVEWTLPAGTVCDSNDCIYVVSDRRAYIAAHLDELTDQVIVGNADFGGIGAVVLNSSDGTCLHGLSSADGVLTFAAKNDEAAAAVVETIAPTLTADDKEAGLSADNLVVCAVAAGDGVYQAVVDVNPTVGAPRFAAAGDDPPVAAATDDEGETVVSSSIDNAVIGLWYGYEVADELGDSAAFAPDAESFIRATANGPMTIRSSPRTEPCGFFRLKVSAAKP